MNARVYDGLRGIIPPLVTPIRQHAVDRAALKTLVDHVVDGGVHGVFIAGTTGEYALLSDEQWTDLVDGSVTAMARRVPLLVGVTWESTQRTIEAANHAARAGADVVVATTPAYFRTSQSEIQRHFESIADQSPVPLMLYNIPQNTGTAITYETVMKLSCHGNIIGLKDSSGQIDALKRLRDRLNETPFALLVGTDVLGDVTVQLGLHGTVPSIANLIPRLVVAAWDAAVRGDYQRSAALHSLVGRYAGVYRLGRTASGGEFIAGLKCAMGLFGLDVGDPILPIGPADDDEIDTVRQMLQEAQELSANVNAEVEVHAC